MAKKPITIGSRHFQTKGEAKQFYRKILDRYSNGDRLETEDDRSIREILATHPEAPQKIGAGIAYFTANKFRGCRHFNVHRIDGSFTDFSYLKCIDGKNKRHDQIKALREAVEDQIALYREQTFAESVFPVCPLRGVRITRKSCHVDHEAPATFHMLTQDWLDSAGLTLEEIQISPSGDNQIVKVMTNPEQKASWQEYHRLHARLRLLSPRANLSEARRK